MYKKKSSISSKMLIIIKEYRDSLMSSVFFFVSKELIFFPFVLKYLSW